MMKLPFVYGVAVITPGVVLKNNPWFIFNLTKS